MVSLEKGGSWTKVAVCMEYADSECAMRVYCRLYRRATVWTTMVIAERIGGKIRDGRDLVVMERPRM